MPHPDDDFTAFAEAAAPRLRRSAYLMVRDWHGAQDLAQTTLAKMYVSWRRVSRSENLHAYSRQVLVRLVLDQKRRRSDSEIVVPDIPERPGPAQDDAALRLTLVDALATLPPRDRAIVVLRYADDLSIDTVAELLGITPGVVRSQSVRSLQRLRVLLGEDVWVS